MIAILNIIGLRSSGGVIPLSTLFGSSTVAWIDDSNPYTMFKESGLTGIGLTEGSLDNDTIGQIYDSGPNVLMLYALSDAGRPLLKSDGTRSSYLEFDGASKVMRFSPSSRLFAGFLSGFASGSGIQPTFTIAFKIKKSVDGVAMVIMDNNDASASGSGFSVQINASNQVELRFNSINASFPVSSIAYTSTKTIVAADGWVDVIIEANQQGASTGKITIGNTEETFAVNGGAGSALVSPEVTIGRRATTADRYLNGGLSQLLVLNRIMTTIEKNLYKSYNPIRGIRTFTTLESRYDFNDLSRGWADASKTVAITNGTAIRAWENYVRQNFKSQNASSPNFKDLTTSTTANTWPIWRTADQNSRNVGEWDGVDDNLDFNEKMPATGGRKTIFVVAKNDDATNGSRIVNDSANTYIVFTGSSYSGNAARNGLEYCAIHFQNASESIAIDLKNQGDTWNIIAVRFDKSSIKIWNGLKQSETSVLSSGFIVSDMGQNNLATWWVDGKIGIYETHFGAMADTDVEARIDQLNTLFNI